MTKINGATIWITGASSGIGEALAYEADQAGAGKLILSARREDELNRVRQACRNSARHAVEVVDLAGTETLEQRTRDIWEQHGPIDIVVHSGGISQRSYCKDTKLEVYQRLMAVNFLGTVAITQALLPYFIERQQGHIVAISSLVGKFGTPLRSGYAASKHALHGYADALAAEVANDGIEVSVICPGFVRTNVSVNALSGDASVHGAMDQGIEKGIDPRECGRRILKAIEHNEPEVFIAGKEMMAVYLKRFAPGLFRRFVQRTKLT